MTSPDSQDRAKRKRVAAGYNQAINLFWSIGCLGPLVYFGYSKMAPVWIYTFLTISALPAFLPNSCLDSIQLGRTVSFYKKLGIRIVRKYTQDGDMINQLLRKQFPQYAPLSPTPVDKRLTKSYVNEKFHYVGLLFFLLTSLYAAIHSHGWWALVLGLTNLVYNVYPILLQQYNRLRLRHLRTRRAAKDSCKIDGRRR